MKEYAGDAASVTFDYARNSELRLLADCLLSKEYQNSKQYFEVVSSQSPTEADKVWSTFATENPINAAAATSIADPFVKFPQLVEDELPAGKIVTLDAGCGYGRVAIPIMRRRRDVSMVGIDASPVMLQYFVSLLGKEDPALQFAERVLLMHSNIDSLPFSEETFDCIYSSAVLLHNPVKAVEKILAEFRRLLKPRGKLILVGSFPNLYNLEGVQDFITLKIRRRENINGPVRAYTRSRVYRLFAEWSSIRVIPTGATVLPRSIIGTALPLGTPIRKLNKWVEDSKFSFVSKTTLFAKSHDVVASK